MYCKSCGTRLEDNVHFCPQCGQAIQESEATDGSNPVAAPANIPVKPKMALWKKILIAVATIIVLAVGLAFFATSGLVDPVERHITALRQGNVQAAYDETSQAFRESTSLEQFSGFVKANPILTKVTDHSFPERKVENGIGTLSGTLTTANGGVQPIVFRLVKENDEWKILGINLNPESGD